MSMIDEKELAALRLEYSRHQLTESAVNSDPFTQFAVWFNEALAAEIVEPNAMTLSTADAEGSPSARVVLLKGFNHDGFTFFTNYASNKARDLDENPRCSLSFFWKELERQTIIAGDVVKVSDAESDEYFESRPSESKIGAWTSDQSSVIASRDMIERNFEELKEKYADGNIPRPAFWGGYRVIPVRFEFWQGRPNRLHDRICYSRENGAWQIFRLSP
jgi:pyridoxamine 5'-phosphate oxidase